MQKQAYPFSLLPRELLSLISKKLSNRDLGALRGTCRDLDDKLSVELHQRIRESLLLRSSMDTQNLTIIKANILPLSPSPWEKLLEIRYARIVQNCCKILQSETNPGLLKHAVLQLENYRLAIRGKDNLMLPLIETLCKRIENKFDISALLEEFIFRFNMNWMFIDNTNESGRKFSSAIARGFLEMTKMNKQKNGICYLVFAHRNRKNISSKLKQQIELQSTPANENLRPIKRQKINKENQFQLRP